MTKEEEYNKALDEIKEELLKESDTVVTKRDLLERFCKINEEYKSMNLLQILANINILIGSKPSVDCVDRKALDKALYERFHEEDSPNNITDVRLGAVRNFVKNFPSVTPTRKKGKWIEERDDYGNITRWHCSNCYNKTGFVTTYAWDYCPNCGTAMEGEQLLNYADQDTMISAT